MGSEPRPGFVVGLEAEARIARRLGWPIGVGGGTADGAARAAERLIADGANGLVSFGLAGGLDPALAAGVIIVPAIVRGADREFATDPALSARLGGFGGGRALLAGGAVLASVAEKSRAWRETRCAAIDLESGAVALLCAQRGIPFAALRAVCDPAGRSLPGAALIALDGAGRIGLVRVGASVLRAPRQIPSLVALARDAARARAALADRIARIA